MQLLIEEVEALSSIASKLSAHIENLFEALSLETQKVKVPGSSSIVELQDYKDTVLRLVEGNVQQYVGGKSFVIYEPGDVLVVAEHLESDFRTDFAVVVEKVGLANFLTACNQQEQTARLWTDYLLLKQDFFLNLSANLVREELHFEPSIQTFSPGDVIIEQGGSDSTVYTMNEGRADVLVDGVKVGEILTDEIFGVIAALTETPRTAQVVATEPSMVLSLPGDKFSELTRVRPATVTKMVSDMARTIVDLNKKVIEK